MGITPWLLDLVFPRRCLGCQQLLGVPRNTYLCGDCRHGIATPVQLRCAFCTTPVIAGKTCPKCHPTHALDRLLVAANYDDELVVHMVKTLKYRFVKIIADDIAAHMARYFKALAARFDLPQHMSIVAVPLHSKRLRWRGFNQTELIATELAHRLSLPYLPDVLQRTHATSPQADIKDRTSRIKNAQGMFGLAVAPLNSNPAVRPLSGKTILLVDDVSTTGATLNDAARVLKSAGAREVIGFVFARG